MKINHWVSQSFFELRFRDMHPDMTGICPRKKHVSDYKTLISDSGALNDPAAFRQEVRTTLLHEIGHYLGLDARDLG